MRTFISVRLNDGAIEEIKRIQKELSKSKLYEGKLTEGENLHLTLKFLGEIPDSLIEEVRNRLRKIKVRGFNVKLGDVGIFSQNFIRIIWIKLQGANELQKSIDEALDGIFDKEKRFMGHLTIARVKRVSDKLKFFELLKKIQVNGIEFEVDNFQIIESRLFSK